MIQRMLKSVIRGIAVIQVHNETGRNV